MNFAVINFINKFGYNIAQTFNDSDGHVFVYIESNYSEKDFKLPVKSYTWSCFFSSQFLDDLFNFSDLDIILTLDEIKLFNEYFNENTGFHFEIPNHEFHIFYFDDSHIYLADYFAEVGRDYFSFILLSKMDILNFIENKNSYLSKLLKNVRFVDIISIKIHPLSHYPTHLDIIKIIEKSFNYDSIVQTFEEATSLWLTLDECIEIYNAHLDLLKSSIK